MLRRITPILTALVLTLVGCNSTTLSTTWKDPSASALVFKKIAVIALNTLPGERRAEEDALVAEIKRAIALPSYTFIPDDELKDVAQAKQKIIAQGFDGAVVFRLVDTRQEISYVSGTTWNDGWGYRSYQSMPGYTVTDTIVRAEISLYSVPAGNLIWAGASESLNPKNARSLAIDVIRAAIAEVRKQGLIQ